MMLWSRHLSHALTCPAFLSLSRDISLLLRRSSDSTNGRDGFPLNHRSSLRFNGRTRGDNWGQPRSLCFPLEWNISSQELQTGLHPRDTYSVNLLLFSPNKELLLFILVLCLNLGFLCLISFSSDIILHLILLILFSSTRLAPPFPHASDTIILACYVQLLPRAGSFSPPWLPV